MRYADHPDPEEFWAADIAIKDGCQSVGVQQGQIAK